jgi:RNA:NAD 2'-phosphotransferase (TPT1/KptA family)
MKITKLLEQQFEIPHFLYHATYKPLLKKIKRDGLRGGIRKNWEDSNPDVVYLSTTPEVAESYAETSDMIPDNYLDMIVVLKIDTSQLPKSAFNADKNVRNDTTDTIEFHGVIPPSAIVGIVK